MNILIFRTVLVYVLIIAAMRLMGKKQLGELQPSELVSTILISNLASISIESPELPLIGSVVPVFLIVSMEIVLSGLCLRFNPIARLVSGSPKIVIQKGVVNQKMLRELRFTPDDLLEALRAKDVFDLSEVDFAVVETNGSVSVYKKFAADTPKNEDLNVRQSGKGGPVLPLVINGNITNENCKYYDNTAEWVTQRCKERHCIPSDVLLLLCDANDEIHLIKKEKAANK